MRWTRHRTPWSANRRRTSIPKIVSDMLGHSQVGITLNLYSHVTPTMQKQAAEAMDGLLRAAQAE
jgi:hypothetical protein